MTNKREIVRMNRKIESIMECAMRIKEEETGEGARAFKDGLLDRVAVKEENKHSGKMEWMAE